MLTNIFYVYALVDPRSNLPFYIGKGKNKRLHDHLTEYNAKENHKKHKKIQQIRDSGYEPVAIILHDCLEENVAYDLETDIIKKYGREDIDVNGILTNNRLKSFPPVMTKEVREKISMSRKGLKFSDEHKEKLKNAKKGKTWEEIYGIEGAKEKRIRNSQPKGPMNEERKQNISIAKKGNTLLPKWSEDRKKKLSESTKGKKKPIGFSEKVKNRLKIIQTCPHCGITGSGIAIQRWHFNNCKKYDKN